MYNFSINISDQIARDIAGKISVSNDLHINNIEIEDSFENRKIVDMNGEELENIRSLLIDNSKKIVLMNCSEPVSEMEYYKALFRKAHMLGVENVKVCMEDTSVDEEVLADSLRTVCSMGKSYGMGVLLENRCNTRLSSDNRMTGIYKAIKQENTGIVFNPLEYAKERKHPFFHEFYNSKLKNEVRFLRVNDGLFIDGSPALPGEGNAEIKEMASILLARGFNGYFSFVPYFERMDVNLYREVIIRFKKMLKEM